MGAPRTTSAASIAKGAFFSAARGLAAFFPPAFAAERKARVRSDAGIFSPTEINYFSRPSWSFTSA